ncbi:MAG: LytR/AlgR family response regulator transcription factor [Saprospiraceae bacterium]
MRTYACIVVDDEPLARELLAAHIQKVPFLTLAAACKNAFEARLALQQSPPDLLFLDIEMPDLNGLDLLRMLPKPPATVLTTAYREHSLSAFDLGVMDYLLKPIEFGRFFKAVSKAIEWLGPGTTEVPQPTTLAAEPAPGHIFVKSDGRLVKVALGDLLFVEAMEKYVRLHLPGGRIVSLMSMSQMEGTLPAEHFLRVHRSFIVNLTKVESVEGHVIHIGRQQVPLSKAQREVFLGKLAAYPARVG